MAARKTKKDLKAEYLRLRADEKLKDLQYRERLILEVSKHICIWDLRSESHRDRLRVGAAWDEIAQAMGKSKVELKKSWKSLKDKFRGIFCGITRGKRSGDGIADVHDKLDAVKWPFFKCLLFLKDVCAVEQTTCNNKDNIEVEIDTLSESPPSTSLPSTSLPLTSQASTSMESGVSMGRGATRDSASTQRTALATKFRNAKGFQSPGAKRRKVNPIGLFQESWDSINRELKKTEIDDSVSRYCDSLADLLRQIHPERQRHCFQEITILANTFIDESNLISISPHTVQIESEFTFE